MLGEALEVNGGAVDANVAVLAGPFAPGIGLVGVELDVARRREELLARQRLERAGGAQALARVGGEEAQRREHTGRRDPQGLPRLFPGIELVVAVGQKERVALGHGVLAPRLGVTFGVLGIHGRSREFGGSPPALVGDDLGVAAGEDCITYAAWTSVGPTE